MAVKHILIVDDQRDARDFFRSSLETLNHQVKITDVPSAEEALLVLYRSAVDLLVCDIRLPGMTGFELQRRIVRISPQTKIILVTGMVDSETRRHMAEAEIAAHFYKPLEVADFLDVVERCLGIVNTGSLPPPVDHLELEPPVNLADSLVNLRKDLGALSVVLLDESGHVFARAGDWSDNEMENQMIPVLMSALNSGEKVANLLGRRPPDNLYSFQGQAFNLLAAHVGPSATLIVVCEAQADENDGLVLQKLRPVARNLGQVLTRLGVDETAQQDGVAAEPLDEFEFSTAAEMQSEQQDLALEDVFPEFEPVDLQAVDSFWDTALEKSEETIRNSDALSYEQARRLGLAPEDHSEPDEEH